MRGHHLSSSSLLSINMSEPIGETTTKTMEESEERNSERHHSKSSSHKKKKKKSSDREHSSSSRRRRSSSSNNGERRSSGDRDSSKKKKRRKSESGERKHRSSRHRESSSSRRRSGREDDPGAAVAKPPPSEQPAVTASPGNQPSAKPGAVSASGGSQQTGKQRRSYGAAAQKPGAVSMSGDGSPQKSGKERPRSTAMPRGDTAQSGKTRRSAPAQRPGAVSMSGDGTTQQQSGKERRAAAQRPGAVSMSGGSQTGKQSRRRSGTTNSEHQQQQQQPGAVAVASPVKRGKGQKSADAGPSMASSADAYALSSRRVGAVADPTPGIRTKDPDVSRTRSGLSSTGDSSRVGATAVASAAPRGKRSRQSRRAPSSDAGSSENTSGHSSNDNDNDRFSSGNPSLGTHVGAYSVAAGASSRGKGDKGKGDGPSVASGAESYDDASRLGAHSVSSAPRRKRGDGSVVSRDGSSTGGVGAQAVASSGSVRKNGAGPTLSEGGDDYSRQNSLSNHSESGKEKGRVSHFPTSDLYASLSSLPGLGTNTENKGRISQFPGEDFYEQDIDDEPLSSHRRSSAGGLPDESEKSRPEYTANGESYGGSRNDQSRRSTRSHHSDQQSRGSSEHPSRRGPTGAFFISGDGENFESRDAVGPLNDGENTSNIDLLASQDTNTSNIDLLDAEAQLTAEVTPVANPPAEGAPNYAMDTSLDNTKPKPWYCSRIFLILVALLVVIGGTVGAVLPLVVFKDGDGGGGLAPPTSSPTSPIDLEREDTIRAIVLELTDVATLDDPSSPQNAAYEWIVKTDMLSPVTIGAVTTEETEKVASRYSLAVFYYATNGDDWISATGWLDGNVDECNWEILSCSNQRVSAISSGAAVAGNNMKGGIPSEIRALTTLSKFLPCQHDCARRKDILI